MIEENLIKADTALLAKQKGFDEYCMWAYDKDGKLINPFTRLALCLAPTQALLQRWFREKHKLEIDVSSDVLGFYVELFDRNTFKRIKVIPNNIFETYEEALEVGLKFALENFNKIENLKK